MVEPFAGVALAPSRSSFQSAGIHWSPLSLHMGGQRGRNSGGMELSGFEPLTSWVRSRNGLFASLHGSSWIVL